MQFHSILHFILLACFVGKSFAQEDDTANNATTQSPTNTIMSPSVAPTRDPFTFRRPLNTVQVRLLGTYSSFKQEELLDSLKILLQNSLYNAMVDYFQVDDESSEQRPFDQQPKVGKSILSIVSLEWTSTRFQVDGDPYMHILQASGFLGFSQYDYVLLHPQTILPLQEKIMAGDNTTNPISLSKLEFSLRRNHLYFQVLQFITVDDPDEEEDAPSQVPTTWEYDDDDDGDGALDGDDDDDEIINNITDLKDNSTINTGSDDYLDRDYDDDYEAKRLKKDSASDKTLVIALIVACTVSTLAFAIFLRFVCIKSNRIKNDRLLRKQSVADVSAGKEKDGIADESERNNEKENKTGDTILTVKSSGTISSAASSPTTSPTNKTNPTDIEGGGDTSANREAAVAPTTEGAQETDDETHFDSAREEEDSKSSASANNWATIIGETTKNPSELTAVGKEPPGWRLPFCSNISPAKKTNSKYFDMGGGLYDL
ncbi:unnamed protein product [Cylindrotheca closterium]|uniref:Uncharacterized protein n=1 Tax=Cylindrotheca closterium TaxID=2856 RepID=A0AAD2CSG8_9STRA|nr:unnamed protein product [Cylindrotheca closterium]